MAERLRRAAAWLGLVTDDRYDEHDAADAELTEGVAVTDAVEDSASITALDSRRSPGRTAEPSTRAGAATAVATQPTTTSGPRTADLSRIITVHPRTYNEARTIGENFRDGVPVIMNLSQMEDSDAKRLVDFAAGLIFGLRGSIERVTSRVFLISPHNVTVTAEDKERIVGGFFNQS